MRVFIGVFIFCLPCMALDKLVIIGDSLTEGYGVDKEFSYPTVLQGKMQQAKLNYQVINGGVSGSTTASGLSRLKWFLKAKPKIVMIALGANDGLRGIDLKMSQKNLQQMIEKCQQEKIKVVLAGMHLPPNYGKEYTTKFRAMFMELKRQNQLTFIPFLLEGVAGKPDLNIADGIHPNEKGYVIVAENVFKHIKELL